MGGGVGCPEPARRQTDQQQQEQKLPSDWRQAANRCGFEEERFQWNGIYDMQTENDIEKGKI